MTGGAFSTARSVLVATTLAVTALLSGCAAVLSPNDRAGQLLAEQGFAVLPSRNDTLAALVAPTAPSVTQLLTVFIEGDGAAWPAPGQPPNDPTPSQPIGLYLAVSHLVVKHINEAVAYLGRPCQYLDDNVLRNCLPAWWTLGRFGDAPLARLNARLDDLKAKAPQARLRLVGYSGGGAVAALLASRHSDVTCLVTVAAPLDTDAWTQAKNVSPLSQSANPLEIAAQLRGLPMTHFAGGQDSVVPRGVNQRFLAAAQSSEAVKAGFSHEGPWATAWHVLAGQSCLVKTPP